MNFILYANKMNRTLLLELLKMGEQLDREENRSEIVREWKRQLMDHLDNTLKNQAYFYGKRFIIIQLPWKWYDTFQSIPIQQFFYPYRLEKISVMDEIFQDYFQKGIQLTWKRKSEKIIIRATF